MTAKRYCCKTSYNNISPLSWKAIPSLPAVTTDWLVSTTSVAWYMEYTLWMFGDVEYIFITVLYTSNTLKFYTLIHILYILFYTLYDTSLCQTNDYRNVFLLTHVVVWCVMDFHSVNSWWNFLMKLNSICNIWRFTFGFILLRILRNRCKSLISKTGLSAVSILV